MACHEEERRGRNSDGRRLIRPADEVRGPLSATKKILLLDLWNRSGLPARDFASSTGLSHHTPALDISRRLYQDILDTLGSDEQPSAGPRTATCLMLRAMKTVLFISSEPVHRVLYERQLKRHFAVEFSASVAGGSGKLDAVVYDLPKYPSPVDYEWLEAFDLPVVILAPDPIVHVPQHAKQLVLYYPVRMDEILLALAKLGVKPGDDC